MADEMNGNARASVLTCIFAILTYQKADVKVFKKHLYACRRADIPPPDMPFHAVKGALSHDKTIHIAITPSLKDHAKHHKSLIVRPLPQTP